MSSVISRPFDDILLDRIVTRLVTFRNEQIAIDASVIFDVDRDRLNPHMGIRRPLVNVWSDDSPARSGSTKNAIDDAVSVNCDLYTRGVDGLKYSDAVAVAKLLYLKEQVRYALYDLNDKRFGFTLGSIGQITAPSWMRMKGQSGIPEETVVAGRISFTVPYSWTPKDVEGVPLDELSWSIKLAKLGLPAPSGGAHLDGLIEY